MSMNTPLRHASRATSPQGARQDLVAVRLVQILRGVRTIFLDPLTEGAVERMRNWGSLTFNTPSVGYADSSLTREARVLCRIRGDRRGELRSPVGFVQKGPSGTPVPTFHTAERYIAFAGRRIYRIAKAIYRTADRRYIIHRQRR